MGCYPTRNFMKPALASRLGQWWKRRNRRNAGAIDGQLNTGLRSGIIIAANQLLTAGFASLAAVRAALGDCRWRTGLLSPFPTTRDGERLWQQQADFEPVVNSHQYLREIERFADEILRPGFRRAQLVIRLGGDHENRKIAVGFDCLQALHHLESIQAGHLKVEPDQGMAVLAVQLADLVRIPRWTRWKRSPHRAAFAPAERHWLLDRQRSGCWP